MKLSAYFRSVAAKFLRRSQIESDMEEELRSHIENRADDLERSGLARAEAEHRARIDFGGYQKYKEEIRESLGAHFLDTLLQDIRFAARMLRKSPGFTAVAVLTLALGIGANTAMFSVVNTVLLQPLPFRNSNRLVSLWTTSSNGHRGSTAYPDFLEIRQRNQSFESVAAYTQHLVNVTDMAYPERVRAWVVSPEFLETLGGQPQLGRDFRAEEGQFGSNSHVVIISDATWRSSFAADPQVVGRSITIDAQPYTIIGVLRPDFWFLDFDVQLLMPLSVPPALNNRSNHNLNMVGRLRPGVAPEVASAELTRIATAVAETYPLNKGVGFHLAPLQEEVTRNVRPAIVVLMAAVGFVLLIAAGNLASLLMARSVVRRRETAVRLALGASRRALLLQFMTESVVLCLLGGTAGIFVASFAASLIRATGAEMLPRASQIHIDATVLLFAMGVSLLTGIIFGIIPMVQASKTDVHQSLKEGGQSSGDGLGQYRLRAGLVASEVALALVLLTGAGLMIRSLGQLQSVDSGFDERNVLTFTVTLPAGKYSDEKLSWFPPATQKASVLVQEAVESISQLPGVSAVGATTTLPLSGVSWDKVVTFYDRPLPRSVEQLPQIEYRPVAGSYFQAMGIRLLRGKTFSVRDNLQSQPVAIVNEEMVRRYMNGKNPIGKLLAVNPPRALLPPSGVSPDYPAEPEKFVIIGVVGNARYGSLEEDARPMVYAPYSQNAEGSLDLSFAIRTDRDPLSVVAGVRQRMKELDKDLPLGPMTTMEQVVSRQIASPQTEMFLLSAFGLLALALASVGVYGIMSYSVAQRAHEIGLRMALGAQPADVLRMVIRQGVMLVGVGVVAGIGGALALTRFLQSLLFGVKHTDPVTFVGVAVLLTLVALAACYIPARRAMKVDPMVALRYE